MKEQHGPLPNEVLVDEERFPWAPPALQHQPLRSIAGAATAPQPLPLLPTSLPSAGANVSAPSTYIAGPRKLCLLSLFSGPYARSDGLKAKLTQLGYSLGYNTSATISATVSPAAHLLASSSTLPYIL